MSKKMVMRAVVGGAVAGRLIRTAKGRWTVKLDPTIMAKGGRLVLEPISSEDNSSTVE